MRKKKKQQVIDLLKSRGYNIIDNDEDYKYLRTMTIDSVEEENAEKLMKEKDKKEKELDIIKKKTIQQMWIHELSVLEKAYDKYQIIRKNKLFGGVEKTVKKKKVVKKKIVKKGVVKKH